MFHIIVTHYLIILFYHYMRVSHKRDVILDFCLVIFMTWHEAWESVLKNYQDLSRSILFVYVSDVRFFDTIFFNTRSPKFLYFILKFRQNILLLLYLSIIHHLTEHHYHNFNKNKPWEKKPYTGTRMCVHVYDKGKHFPLYYTEKFCTCLHIFSF